MKPLLLLFLTGLAALFSTAFQKNAPPPVPLAAPPSGDCSSPCDPSDSLALVEIYKALDGVNWTSPWDLSTCVKTWEGVKLDEAAQPFARVQWLDLDGEIEVQTAISKTDNCAKGRGLKGVFPSKVNLPELQELSLNGNAIQSPFPDFSSLTQLTDLGLNCTQLSGALPGGVFPQSLKELYLENAQLSGPLPDLDLPNLIVINLKKNPDLSDPLPAWSNLPLIKSLALSRCSFQGTVPGFGHLKENTLSLFCPYNRFTFEDMLPNWNDLKKHFINAFDPQQPFSSPATRQVVIGCPFRWDLGIDDGLTTSTYQWFQNGTLRSTTDSNTLVINEMPTDWGGTWTCQVTNSIVTEVTLNSHPLTVTLCLPEIMDVDTALCYGQSLTVRGVLYNEQNPMGKQQLIGKATNGCDSVIRVQLRYPGFRAGPDTFVCRNTLPLRAGLPPGATGLWTAAPAALIADPAAPVTTASGLQAGETRFFWTVDFVGCPPATDTFAVFFDQPPTALPDSLTIFIDKNGSGNFRLNDLFFDPATDLISVLPLTSGGDFEWDDDGEWTFDPAPLYWGTFRVRYSLCSSLCPPEFCDTAEIKIKVVPERQPEFVSANGDGINDVLVMRSLAADPAELPQNELLIVSTDGSIVLRAEGYRNDWPSGPPPPKGVYYYFFKNSPDEPPMSGLIVLTH